MEKDERILESNKFINDDKKFNSKEFMTCLYNYKGKIFRKIVPHINPKNEKELMENLKEDIKKEVENMTSARGR